ncbi:hypothetical protein AAFP35_23165 [Gordonia sp. CPCC 206044]|uniref:hypothetical protein n=1 Tax=Gordonia sp. CPCC 206044 TaxID=3140793 RepID=UPI003AF3F177
MTSDDTSGASDRARTGHDHGAGADPIRDFLLGVAGQIDQLAAMFAAPAPRTAAASGPDLSGEITSLLTEIGDLLARLIAALIAVLEAIAKALRSTPSTAPGGAARYQPIAVRIRTDDHADHGDQI